MPNAILIPIGNGEWRVENIGTPVFWPQDGDKVDAKTNKLLRSEGWRVTVQKETTNET